MHTLTLITIRLCQKVFMLTIKLILVRGFLLFYDCCKNAVFPVIPAHKMQLGLTLSPIHKLLFVQLKPRKNLDGFG